MTTLTKVFQLKISKKLLMETLYVKFQPSIYLICGHWTTALIPLTRKSERTKINFIFCLPINCGPPTWLSSFYWKHDIISRIPRKLVKAKTNKNEINKVGYHFNVCHTHRSINGIIRFFLKRKTPKVQQNINLFQNFNFEKLFNHMNEMICHPSKKNRTELKRN